MADTHDVTLTIDATAYGGWKSIDVSRSIETVCGGFELVCSDVEDDRVRKIIKPGASCSVQLDGKTVITGYIDETTVEHSAADHTLLVRGRDKAADLVDCAAIHASGVWFDQAMVAVCKNLCDPYGVKVSADVDVSRKMSIWNIEPGESVWENIERMARAYGVLVISDGLGAIKITRPGKERVETALVLGENILSGSATLDHSSRFSEYRVLAQRVFDEDTGDPSSTEQEGRATDSGVNRKRIMIEIFEDGNADIAVLRNRANWRRAVNIGRSERANINVQGWSHASNVWKPNTLVKIEHAPLGFAKAELLIVSVRHTLDRAGSRTELSLAPKGAYHPEEVPGETFE